MEKQEASSRNGDDPDRTRRKKPSSLVVRNVVVSGRRTSLKLEPTMWEALQEISLREGLSVSSLCTRVEERRMTSGLTAAVRVYILSYFRAAATDRGHAAAGHGRLTVWRRAS